MSDEIRFRSQPDLKKRIKKVASAKHKRYQALAREVLYDYVEAEERAAQVAKLNAKK